MGEGRRAPEDLRRLLVAHACEPEQLELLLAAESVTDLDLRHALRGRVPAELSVHILERSRFGTRPAVLGALALSTSTPPRVALQTLGGLAWRDLAEVAVRSEIPPAVRQKAEAHLLDGLSSLRLGDLITLARVAPARVVRRLLLSPDLRVRKSGLLNPRLRARDLGEVIESREAPLALAAEALDTGRWAAHYEVRRSIARSPRTPHAVSLSVIGGLNRGDLRDLSESVTAPPLIVAVARRLLG